MPARNISVYALTEDRLDLAYPLAREADRKLSLEEWRRFANARIAAGPDDAQPPGILLAERSGYLRGLAVYDISEINGAQVLVATNIVVFDGTREQSLALDLLGGLLRIAEAAKCDRLNVNLPRSNHWLRARWSDPGGRVFRLPVECSTSPGPADTRKPARSADVLDFRARH